MKGAMPINIVTSSEEEDVDILPATIIFFSTPYWTHSSQIFVPILCWTFFVKATSDLQEAKSKGSVSVLI